MSYYDIDAILTDSQVCVVSILENENACMADSHPSRNYRAHLNWTYLVLVFWRGIRGKMYFSRLNGWMGGLLSVVYLDQSWNAHWFAVMAGWDAFYWVSYFTSTTDNILVRYRLTIAVPDWEPLDWSRWISPQHSQNESWMPWKLILGRWICGHWHRISIVWARGFWSCLRKRNWWRFWVMYGAFVNWGCD